MVDLTHLLIDVENQKQYNSCVGQSLSTYLEAIWKKFDPDNAKEFSPAFIWALAKGEEKADLNRGVIPAFAFIRAQKIGCCLESDFPYIESNLNRYPTPEELKLAKPYRICKFKVIGINDIKEYLDKGLPVSVSVDMGGGHQVCLFGYDDSRWLIVNSWGTGWMQAGMHWMPDDEFKKIFRVGYVITGLKWQFLKDAKKWFREMFK